MRIPLLQPRPEEFCGELETERLLDVLALVCSGGRPLQLELEGDPTRLLLVRGGAVVAARAGDQRGRAALKLLLGDRSKLLTLRPAPASEPAEFELRLDQHQSVFVRRVEAELPRRLGGSDSLMLLELHNYRGDLLLRYACPSSLPPGLESQVRQDGKLQAALKRFLQADRPAEVSEVVEGYPLLLRYLPRAHLFARLLVSDGRFVDYYRRWIEKVLESVVLQALWEAVESCCRGRRLVETAQQGRIILIITDRFEALEQLREALAEQGYAVHVAHDGEQGLEIAREILPNLIISDIALRIMDGWELLWMVRKDPDLKDTPFVFRSEDGSWMEEERDLEHGADGMLPASFQADRVLEKVKTIFHDR